VATATTTTATDTLFNQPTFPELLKAKPYPSNNVTFEFLKPAFLQVRCPSCQPTNSFKAVEGNVMERACENNSVYRVGFSLGCDISYTYS